MRLAFNKKQTESLEQADLTTELYKCHKKHEFLLMSVRTLLQFIKEFAGRHILPSTIMSFEKCP